MRIKGIIQLSLLVVAVFFGNQITHAQTATDIPNELVISRVGQEAKPTLTRTFPFDDLTLNNPQEVFVAPPCLEGNYYVSYQLVYDLANRNTQEDWSTDLELRFLFGGGTSWEKNLSIGSDPQIILASVFHDEAISCDDNYLFEILSINNVGTVPPGNISLVQKLFRVQEEISSASIFLDFTYHELGPNEYELAWDEDGTKDYEFEVEWVFIDDLDLGLASNVAIDAFAYKTGAGITTKNNFYKLKAYYPEGRLFFRVRAVGENASSAGHKIKGEWNYGDEFPLTIQNHNTELNWQQTTTYAEDGKNKRIITYLDGSLRGRQTLVNLNTEDIVLSSETFYDYEGRSAVQTLPAPLQTSNLGFKTGLNTFSSIDSDVEGNTTNSLHKFHYDNRASENSILSPESAVTQYYSSANSFTDFSLRDYIPESDGYGYTQTTFTPDNTGRISRQSGVGETFRIDGGHTVKNFYGTAAPIELYRLFGNNVGNALHYKKNLTSDPNGQTSLTYLDQEGRVVATALAGDTPTSLDALESNTSLPVFPIEIDLTPKNEKSNGESQVTHRALNITPGTSYEIKYDLKALASLLENGECVDCAYDLQISITDPLGKQIALPAISGNEAEDNLSFIRTNLSATTCSDETNLESISFNVIFAEEGDYSISKRLIPRELTFSQIETIVSVREEIVTSIEEIRNSHVVDLSDCELCQSCVSGFDLAIIALGEIVELNCENIEEPCHQNFCFTNRASEEFDIRMSLPTGFNEAGSEGLLPAIDEDPFFNNDELSGFFEKDNMNTRLSNISFLEIGGITGDTHDYSGTILEVTDINNENMRIGSEGQHDVNGIHILYYDLQDQLNQGEITTAEFNTAVDRQRWSLYRGLYLEAKRQVTLEVATAQNCPSLVGFLNEVYGLPTTREGAENFGEAEGFLGGLTEDDLKITINSIVSVCGIDVTTEDANAMGGFLADYFNRPGAEDVLYQITLVDLNAGNASLVAIDNILMSYGCSLRDFAVDVSQALICIKERVVPIQPTTGAANGSAAPPNGEASTQVAQSRLLNEQAFSGVQLERQIEQKKLLMPKRTGVAGSEAKIEVEPQQSELALEMPDLVTSTAAQPAEAAAMASVIPPSERAALIALYNSTNGDGWSRKRNWKDVNGNFTMDESTWQGLAIENGHVTVIVMFNNILVGTIPDEIGDLTFLETLNMPFNQLSGSIPSTIDGLTNLKSLVLNNNQLTGIPAEIGNMASLEEFHIGDNPFPAQPIPSQIGNIGSLKKFEAFRCSWTGPLPSTFSNLTNLELLDISFNNITGDISAFSYAGLTALNTLDIAHNLLEGEIPNSLATSPLKILDLTSNQLTGEIPSFLGNIETLLQIKLGRNNLTGSIPPELGQLPIIQILEFDNNQLTGTIPHDLANLTTLFTLDLGTNNLEGEVPSTFGALTNMTDFVLEHNNFTGGLPLNWDTRITKNFDVSNNNFDGNIPLEIFERAQNAATLDFTENRFTFENILPILQLDRFQPVSGSIPTILFGTTQLIDRSRTQIVGDGLTATISAGRDRFLTPGCEYVWFKDGVQITNTPNSGSIDIFGFDSEDEGNYQYVVTSPYQIGHGELADDYEGLTFTSEPIAVSISDAEFQTVCTVYSTAQPAILNINASEIIAEERAACEQNLIDENEDIINIEIEKLIIEEASDLLIEYGTNCLNNANETFSYKYIPREYHHTLYYYDQSGNLVQTVPPKGVRTLNTAQVDQIINNGTEILPDHQLVTNYKYNSLDQLIQQNSPDGGITRFAYDRKGQLRISQNAVQINNDEYSYTKYDALGRIVEVGQVSAGDDFETIASEVDDQNYPLSGVGGISLTQITRTFYDEAASAPPAGFVQENLRSRVSYVETLIDPTTVETSTLYSYDIHGNVKGLVQQLSGFEPKRTDYVYDLVSGNVNYVMFQYGQPDQFIQKYIYDEDSRIREVYSSTDGFVFHKEAIYTYYPHGPLARVELGEYAVQGLDYYYTLQGWLKGVNMPEGEDPGADGDFSGKDEFAFTLGYHENDFQPITASVGTSGERLNLWQRHDETFASEGLYNGNISWMATDLAEIGRKNSDEGIQAMLYRYDQLNRIKASRSLTDFTAGSGFNARGTGAQAYDTDYTYDGNGNLLNLIRYDDQANLLNDLTYLYKSGTNQLEEVIQGVVVNGNSIANQTLTGVPYIQVTGNNNLPSGTVTTLEAGKRINLQPGFNSSGGEFHAGIVQASPNEPDVFTPGEGDLLTASDLSVPYGTYEYDEIGNLIFDEAQGVTIQWTVHGKVSEVTNADGSSTLYKYDGAGNRIEKHQVAVDGTTKTTQYVRDAGGNIMAIYKDSELSEQPIYGSSRIGQYNGGTTTGSLTFGQRTYELSNHLGNVLTTVSDKINVANNEQTASVVAASDYYPFGMAMPGRTFRNSDYRYGFNGKEKDEEGEFGSQTSYDYGFRIYNPALGKFLSVDPLTKSYPMLTPYQFASNSPISQIDLDGLEGVWFVLLEGGGGVGINGNFLYVQQEGIAFDDAGKTHFTIHSYNVPFYDDLQSGSNNFFGGEIGLIGAFKYDQRGSFLHAAEGTEITPFGKDAIGNLNDLASFQKKGHFKAKLGISFSASSNSFTLGAGPSIGISGSATQDDIMISISISNREVDKLNDLDKRVIQRWKVNVISTLNDGTRVGNLVTTKTEGNQEVVLVNTDILVTAPKGSNAFRSQEFEVEAEKAQSRIPDRKKRGDKIIKSKDFLKGIN